MNKKSLIIYGTIFILAILITFVSYGVVAYILFHFISKFW